MTRTEDWADYLDPSEPDPDLPPEQVRALERVTRLLAGEPVWSQPPPDLRATILAAAAREAAGPATTGPTTTSPTTVGRTTAGPTTTGRTTAGPEAVATGAAPLPPPIPLRRRSRRAWYLSAAGVAAAAALVVVLAWPRPHPTSFALAGPALAPRANAVAELEPRSAGVAITLHVKGLAPAPPGAYYAAWLRGPAGIVPVGTFHWHKGGIPIDLWSGVGGDRYPELFITLQREGQPPTPSSDVVLSGHGGG